MRDQKYCPQFTKNPLKYCLAYHEIKLFVLSSARKSQKRCLWSLAARRSDKPISAPDTLASSFYNLVSKGCSPVNRKYEFVNQICSPVHGIYGLVHGAYNPVYQTYSPVDGICRLARGIWMVVLYVEWIDNPQFVFDHLPVLQILGIQRRAICF